MHVIRPKVSLLKNKKTDTNCFVCSWRSII